MRYMTILLIIQCGKLETKLLIDVKTPETFSREKKNGKSL